MPSLHPPARRAHAYLLFGSALLGSALLSGCGKSGAADEQANQAPPPQAVTVVTLKAEDVTLTRELAGRATPSLIAEVRPQVSGIVKGRLFDEGGTVQAGQPLYQLADLEYAADAASARAALARAKATLQQAELSARRSGELVKIDAVSRQDDENAQATLAQAKADAAAAQAALQRSEVLLGYARIVSPISGIIGRSSVTQGALVIASQEQPLALVQRLDPMYVDVTQSSSELLDLRREMAAGTLKQANDLPVRILLEDGTTYAREGKLAFTDVTVDPTTGSYTLRVTVPNPDGVLLPGMYVRALVGNGVRSAAVLVPQQSVARDPKGNMSAMVVGKDNKIVQRPLEVSRTIGNRWLVDKGLNAGERVVVEGLQKIGPGATVAPAEVGAAAQAKPAAAAANAAAAQPAKS